MSRARVIKIVSNQYTLLLEDSQKVVASARGKLHLSLSPLVGDYVEYVVDNGHYLIEKVTKRINELSRPSIANVDQAVIVMSLHQPDFSYQLVDRLLFLIVIKDIKPAILLTKTDLAKNDEEIQAVINEYAKAGYLIGSSADSEFVRNLFKDKLSVLTGQSGVGKSTILNNLDVGVKIATQPISKALGRGKHTTRHVELFEISQGWVGDTPGFSSLDFSKISSRELREKIPDFQLAQKCKYDDCHHDKEPGCKVKEGVEKGFISKRRYEDYLAVLPLCDKIKEWEQ